VLFEARAAAAHRRIADATHELHLSTNNQPQVEESQRGQSATVATTTIHTHRLTDGGAKRAAAPNDAFARHCVARRTRLLSTNRAMGLVVCTVFLVTVQRFASFRSSLTVRSGCSIIVQHTTFRSHLVIT
jgi:hypothetical protein